MLSMDGLLVLGQGSLEHNLGAPLVADPIARFVIIVFGYVITLSFSGLIVRWLVKPRTDAAARDSAAPAAPPDAQRRPSPSTVIGKCENIITVTLVITNQITGLALIFAAKSWARSDAIKDDPGYYLGGTLVNLVWSMIVAFLVKILAVG
jgi:hypothetical protein